MKISGRLNCDFQANILSHLTRWMVLPTLIALSQLAPFLAFIKGPAGMDQRRLRIFYNRVGRRYLDIFNRNLGLGRKMVAAGYALYGSATMVVLSTPGRVDGFTLDPVINLKNTLW
jgi:hypothetical protein